jgi:hypothetical protein
MPHPVPTLRIVVVGLNVHAERAEGIPRSLRVRSARR